MDTFSTYHPVINFIYFVIVIGLSMFFMHPVFLVISLICSMAYGIYLKGKKAMKVFFFAMLPSCLLMAIINPLFSHAGATMLFYMKDGNPVTLESILYGIGARCHAGRSCILVLRIQCRYDIGQVHVPVRQSDPGGLAAAVHGACASCPALSARSKRSPRRSSASDSNVNNGKLYERAVHGLKILSITTTWALENSVETADSMKSRAYGLRGRTNFSIYRFDRRDSILLTFLLGVFALILAAMGQRMAEDSVFPCIYDKCDERGSGTTVYSVCASVRNAADFKCFGGYQMALFEVRNLTFTYPGQDRPALRDLNFSVEEGEFLVVCGKSGCGKSTLLRHFKTAMSPYGVREGQLLFDGRRAG